MMPQQTLAQQQQALLAVLFAGTPAERKLNIKTLANYAHIQLENTDEVPPTLDRGLQTYLANGEALAERSLASSYPVVRQLLGAASFADLACAVWQAHPPVRGDVARWGEHLAAFMQTDPQLASEPYLPDVARAEWAMHQSAGLDDHAAQPASFALLTAPFSGDDPTADPTVDPTRLYLQLAPGTAVLASRWPVAAIVQAHQAQAARDGSEGQTGPMDEDGVDQEGLDEFGVGARLAAVGQQIAALQVQPALPHGRLPHASIVWRSGYQPRLREALPGEAAFVAAVLQGHTLGQALDASAQHHPVAVAPSRPATLQDPEIQAKPAFAALAAFDLAYWLPMAVQSGLLLAFAREPC